MKKRIFKKNQIIVTALAILIAVAGYINYADSALKKEDSAGSASAGEEAPVEEDAPAGEAVPDEEDPAGKKEEPEG